MRGGTPTRKLERLLWQQGNEFVVGMDEVGRGCLAGPLAVGAVILPERCRLSGVRDSKFLSPLQREAAAIRIRRQAIAIGIGWSSSAYIDEYGLTAALKQAASRAIEQIRATEAAIILDGKHNYLGQQFKVTVQIKADQSCLAAAAASVIAKVARDRYMAMIHQLHPSYAFETNKGYGSKAHLEAMQSMGPTPFHRLSYRPVGAASVLN